MAGRLSTLKTNRRELTNNKPQGLLTCGLLLIHVIPKCGLINLLKHPDQFAKALCGSGLRPRISSTYTGIGRRSAIANAAGRRGSETGSL